jgi:hypothetical protein
MKEYLLKFRSQAFDGAIALFKRILLHNILLNFVMTVISLAIITPLMLKSFGWTLSDFINLGNRMKEASQTAGSGNNPFEIFTGVFEIKDPLFFVLAIILGLIIYCWIFYTFMKLNDNEVRTRNNSFISALAASFSSKIFSILVYSVLYAIFYTIVLLVYMFLVSMLVSVSKVAGILIGFIGFFVVAIFMIRFTLGLPAIVHGNMSISQAISFSYKNLTWKRSALIFLISIILGLAMALLLGILTFVIFLIINKDTESIRNYVIQQIFSSLAGSIIGAFIYASMTTLYFRYSDDMVEEMDVKDHLIN